MEALHSLSAAVAAVSIVALIAWSLNSCTQMDKELREACIRGGGSVINAGTNFHCVRIGGPAGEH